MIRPIQFLLISLILSTGCAYFNTFYNARMYYQKAYQETKKNRTGRVNALEKTNYQKAIEKAAKLIEEYPNSKYVDDAHLLLGKSFYHQQEYLKANRKFMEVLSNFKETEVVDEARLWLAKTQVELGYFDEAESQLIQFVDKEKTGKLAGEAYYALGKLFEEKQKYSEAIQFYEKAVQSNLEEKRAEAIFSIGANYDSLGNYNQAAKFFNRTLKYSPTLQLRFEANFRFGLMQKKKGQIDEAIRIFENLLGDEKYNEWTPRLRLEIAECLVLKGDVEDGILAYQDIVEDFKSTKSNYGAEAHYRLGFVYEKESQDFERARDHFQEVKKLNPRSLLADTAEVKVREIQRFLALKQVIHMGKRGENGVLILEEEEVQEDSLTANKLFTMMDSTNTDSAKFQLLLYLGGETFLDSIKNELDLVAQESGAESRAREIREEDMIGINWWRWVKNNEMPSDDALEEEITLFKHRQEKNNQQKLAENPELQSFRVEEKDKNLFLLAEHYLFHFEMVDSAMKQYQIILREFPESVYAPRALYNMGYILKNTQHDTAAADTCFRRLIVLYPNSNLAGPSKRAIGLLYKERTTSGFPDELFKEAESSLFEADDPIGALEKYQTIFNEFPNSEWTPKAVYSMGWIYENRFNSVKQAAVLYDSLITIYPESPYAEKVLPKLTAIKLEKEKRQSKEAQKRELTDMATLSDSTAFFPISSDSLNADSTTVIRPIEQIDSLKDTKEAIVDSLGVIQEQTKQDTLM